MLTPTESWHKTGREKNLVRLVYFDESGTGEENSQPIVVVAAVVVHGAMKRCAELTRTFAKFTTYCLATSEIDLNLRRANYLVTIGNSATIPSIVA
jgi:hypothetical protein